MGASHSHYTRDKPMFRGGRYCKFVLLGKRTIKAGERAALWSLGGKCREMEGPRRVWFSCTTVRFLDRHVADQFHYLRVEYRNGMVEHLPGPISMFENPVLHEAITVEESVSLNSGEAIAVYSQHSTGVPSDGPVKGAPAQSGAADPGATRRVVWGPQKFVPTAAEWVHVFRWTSPAPQHKESAPSNGNSKVASKVSGGVRALYDAGVVRPRAEGGHVREFVKLPTGLQHHPVEVTGVRTADDHDVTLHVALYVRVVDVNRLLDGAPDPVGDLSSALQADAMALGGRQTLEALTSSNASALSNLASYPALCERAAANGMEVGKVVYRGYEGAEEARGAARRTQLRRAEQALAAETAERDAAMAAAAAERSAAERSAMLAAQQATAEQERALAEQSRALRRAEAKETMELDAARGAQETARLRERAAVETERMRELHSLGVDLTRILVEECAVNKAAADARAAEASAATACGARANTAAPSEGRDGGRLGAGPAGLRVNPIVKGPFPFDDV